MARVKSKGTGVPVTVKLQADVARTLRELVKRDSLSLSTFVQNAVVRAIRSYRSPMEFIAEGRAKAERSPAPGGLDLTLDRQDGVPLAHAEETTEGDWRTLWGMMSEEYMQLQVNNMRREIGRELLTEPEWRAIVQHMGCVPGLGRQPTRTELTSD